MLVPLIAYIRTSSPTPTTDLPSTWVQAAFKRWRGCTKYFAVAVSDFSSSSGPVSQIHGNKENTHTHGARNNELM